MKKKAPHNLAGYLLLLLFASRPMTVAAQGCLSEGVTFTTQEEINSFASRYPDCSRILGHVVIQEAERGSITTLRGLAGITHFEQSLEIHDNSALLDLSGLENVVSIGSLNIFGNPGLRRLKGLEQLETLPNSLRIAFNHALEEIGSLGQLRTIGEDFTISDNRKLISTAGLNNLTAIGGYLSVLFNESMVDLKGLESLVTLGKGLLLEENPQLRGLNGLSALTSIGGNCQIINNVQLRSLEGLESVESINGNLQIAENPYLIDLTALSRVRSINGLLLIYRNVGLKSLAGLDSIDYRSIQTLGILSCDILTDCSVKSVCDYLMASPEESSISYNGNGCNYLTQILDSCREGGINSSPPLRKEPVFFPNPTGGALEVRGEGIQAATYEVADRLGRVLMMGTLEPKKIDLSELAAGMYFIRLRAERFQVTRKVVKMN